MAHKVEDTLSIDVFYLKKQGYFALPRFGRIAWTYGDEPSGSVSFWVLGNRVRFMYTITDRYSGEATEMDYYVPLLTTLCHLGGIRYWFQCLKCHRRVGTLYFVQGQATCRRCNRLYYRSQYRKTNAYSRALGAMFRGAEIEDKINALRVTHYRGRLTKRYRKLLGRCKF